MKQIFSYLLVVFFSLNLVGCEPSLPKAKITVKVIDENGKPVKNADVKVDYNHNLVNRDIWGGDKTIQGKTDKRGILLASGNTIIPLLTVNAYSNDGYYSSSEWVNFTSYSNKLDRWEPWNPLVEIILKKKRNPVPMYTMPAKWVVIPIFDKPIGFDLEKGDWVKPYGTGDIKDFVFVFNLHKRGFLDYETGFELTFSNAMDGIQEYYFDDTIQSHYKWPFLAPNDGYLKRLQRQVSSKPDKIISSNFKKQVNYIFRVRSKTDKNGKIIEAKYGKIVKEFDLVRDGVVRFRYMYNPDGTRNLEADPDKKLLNQPLIL